MCCARRAARRTGRAGGPPRTCEQKGKKTNGDIDLPVSVAVAAVVVAVVVFCRRHCAGRTSCEAIRPRQAIPPLD